MGQDPQNADVDARPGPSNNNATAQPQTPRSLRTSVYSRSRTRNSRARGRNTLRYTYIVYRPHPIIALVLFWHSQMFVHSHHRSASRASVHPGRIIDRHTLPDRPRLDRTAIWLLRTVMIIDRDDAQFERNETIISIIKAYRNYHTQSGEGQPY